MRILITGGDGLLAAALHQTLPSGWTAIRLGRADFDLQQPAQMAAQLATHRPDAVINTAAYNAVDRCEVERELSWAINATGPATLAELCSQHGCRLVHYGSDYAFDGRQQHPYTEDDPPAPINHYAAGKLAGEQAVLSSSSRPLVLRTSWLFGINPHRPQRSYVHAILKQALAGQPIRATTDQVSAPTYVPDLARWTMALLQMETGGLFHAVNDEGLSRYDWTRGILTEAVEAGLIRQAPPVEPVTTAFFNSTIRRSTYSVMSNSRLTRQFGHPLGSWRSGLKAILHQPLWPEAVSNK